MSHHQHLGRRITGVLAGSVMIAGSLIAGSAPAQAYSPDPTGHVYHRNTANCPYSGGTLPKSVYNLSLPEGTLVTVRVYDDASRKDWIVTGEGKA